MRNYLPRAVPMIRNRRGFGDASCGDNPCTWWDDVYLRDACKAFLTCSNPADPLLVMTNQGLIVGGAQVVGSTVGQAVSTGVESAAAGVAVNPSTGQINWMTIGLIAAAALILLPRLVGGR